MSTAPTTNIIECKNEFNQLKFNLQGGLLLGWTQLDTGIEVFYQGFDEKRTGLPLLFPFADSLTKGIYKHTNQNMARHGFGRNLLWNMDKCTDNQLEVCINSEDLSEEMRQAYPFNFSCHINLDISKPKTLKYRLTVKNKGNETMAIAPGLHPYFNIEHTHKHRLSVAGIPKFNAGNYNWNQELEGGLYFENPGSVKAFLPNGNTIEVIDSSPDPENRFGQTVIWSQNITFPDYNFVCIEQFTKPKNGLNDDPILIPEDQQWIGEITYILK